MLGTETPAPTVVDINKTKEIQIAKKRAEDDAAQAIQTFSEATTAAAEQEKMKKAVTEVGAAAPKTDPDTSAKTTANKWHLGRSQQEATAKKLAEILKIDAANITFKEEKLSTTDLNKKDVFHTLVKIPEVAQPVTVLDFHCGKSLDTAENWRNAFPNKTPLEQNELMAQIMLAQFVAMNPHFKGEIPLTCRKDAEGDALFKAIKKVVSEQEEYKDLTVPNQSEKTPEPAAVIKTPSSSPSLPAESKAASTSKTAENEDGDDIHASPKG